MLVCVSADMSRLCDMLQNMPNVTTTTNMSNDVDYYFGRDYNSQHMPKRGMMIVGSDLSRPMHMFDLEEKFKYNDTPYFFFRRKGVHPIHDNVTFVVQGLEADQMICSTAIAFMFGKLIISTWQKYDITKVETDIKENKYHNNQNVYYQVYTSLNGLEKCTSEYVIKIRSDEVFVNYNDFVDAMFANPDKLVCTNVFLRASHVFPYHISDHIIGGRTSAMLSMFRTAKSLIETRKTDCSPCSKCKWFPEQVLTIAYLSTMYPWDHLSQNNSSVLLKKHFISVDVTTFKYFEIAYSSRIRMTTRWKKECVTPSNFSTHERRIIDARNIEST
jgi:hypothetical protein